MRTPLLLAALTGLIATPATPQNPTAAAKALMLELDVVAVDGQGKPVADLKPGDVEVWLESYRLPLQSLTVLSDNDERRRRSVILILDDMTVAHEMIPRIRRSATEVIERLEPGDRLSFGLLSDGGILTTATPAVVRQAIDRFNVRASAPWRADDLSVHVFATLTNIARQVAETPGRRKTLITVGPGWVFDTPIPPPSVSRNLRAEWTTTLRDMALSNVVLYVLDPGGVGSSPVSGGTVGLARDTGGHAFMNSNDVPGAIDRIMAEASNYYVVHVEDPPFFRTAPLRKVDVRTKRKDVTLRARTLIAGTGTK